MNDPQFAPRNRLAAPSLPWRPMSTGLCVLCVGAVAVAPRVTLAQTVSNEFSAERFDPAPGPRNFFVTRTARSDGEKAWSAGLVFDYASKPLTVQTCDKQAHCGDVSIVETMAVGHLMGSFTIRPQFQLGLRVPLAYVTGHPLDRATFAGVPGSNSGFAVGDPMLEGKYRLLGRSDSPFAAALAAFVTVPTASAMAKDKYIGDSSVAGGLRAIADVKLNALSFAGNVAGVFRKTAELGDASVGNEIRASAAAGLQVSPILKVVAETFGNSRFVFKDNGTSALEGLLGAQLNPMSSPLMFSAGLGTGLIRGVGAPNVRAFVGLTYIHENNDRDGDGILDDVDQCPAAAEDVDGYQDSDGCPDPDNDGDGIVDQFDKCPQVAEDLDNFEDQDGCPEADNDKDGIPDDADHCPNEPETKNGYKDQDGCPDEADQDGDGVPDVRDKCPAEPEDTDGFEDEDGCPDLDNDKDGVPDVQDECLNEPESLNGFQDEDGCPDEDPAEDQKKKKK